LVIRKSVFFVEAFDKVSIFCEFVKSFSAFLGFFLNCIHEFLRSKDFFNNVLFDSTCKVDLKIVFGRKFFIQCFSFEFRDEALKSKLLLFSLIFDFFENEELFPGFGEDLDEDILIELKIIEFNNGFKGLFLGCRATSTIDKIF
jgi:hypothetical protein